MPAEVYQSILNNVDDSQGHDVISANALEAIGNIFPQSGWGGPEKGGFEYSWAGIIGMVIVFTAITISALISDT